MSGRGAPSPGLLGRLRGHVVGQAVMFTAVGAATTLANAVLYLLLRGTFSAEVSNVLSVLTTTIASSLAHRWWVFSDRDEHPMRMHLQTIAVFSFYCASNQLALQLLGLAVDDPSSAAEAGAVAAMALFGGTSRFLAMRLWVFARRARVRQQGPGSGRDRGVVRERPGR
ncbi:GtrA family protein [Saccharopolyspora dendranthemae]|uniref:Putative flippase GtrA n=1 Tax=Saccharopolyspora dendranthemae TaxID=1181886 RepID=A0A561V8B5_9PSEU|nr:GtrA family protein [Saccharopolyspora dendranthemae]TWG07843.1 putative flippase GtrA [Saccharopolyspora dendranthemae]